MTFGVSGYDYLPSLLDERELSYLSATLDDSFEDKYVEYDEGRGMVKMLYKPPCAEQYHQRVQYFLQSYLRMQLLPTYWFCTRYFNQSYMAAHTDRDACEISVSLNVQRDKPWDLQLRDRFGKKHRFDTPPGDGVLYHGVDLEHWRTPYGGQQYTQLFFHYVRATGDYNREQGDRHWRHSAI